VRPAGLEPAASWFVAVIRPRRQDAHRVVLGRTTSSVTPTSHRSMVVAGESVLYHFTGRVTTLLTTVQGAALDAVCLLHPARRHRDRAGGASALAHRRLRSSLPRVPPPGGTALLTGGRLAALLPAVPPADLPLDAGIPQDTGGSAGRATLLDGPVTRRFFRKSTSATAGLLSPA